MCIKSFFFSSIYQRDFIKLITCKSIKSLCINNLKINAHDYEYYKELLFSSYYFFPFNLSNTLK